MSGSRRFEGAGKPRSWARLRGLRRRLGRSKGTCLGKRCRGTNRLLQSQQAPCSASHQGEPYGEEDVVDMPENDVVERLHAVETAQAVQAAVQAGADATQVATQAGAATTNAATHAGTWSAMVAGAAGLVAGIFLG